MSRVNLFVHGEKAAVVALVTAFSRRRTVLLAEFSLIPLDKGAAVGRWVSRSLDIIDRSGVPYRLGPMGTCVEGEWDQVMGLLRSCFESMTGDCERISIPLKGDWRRGASGRPTAKIEKVEATLGRKLTT